MTSLTFEYDQRRGVPPPPQLSSLLLLLLLSYRVTFTKSLPIPLGLSFPNCRRKDLVSKSPPRSRIWESKFSTLITISSYCWQSTFLFPT